MTSKTVTHAATQGSSPLTLLLAVTCALAVATVYVAQPLLDSMALSLGVSPAMIGIVVTVTQVGYAAGLLFIVPLGDLLNRKAMVLGQLLLSAAALVAASMAQHWWALLGAMGVVGLMAVVVQVLVAYAAVLAPPHRRGQAVGTVTSGVVIGILLARLVSGSVADLAGWRMVYLMAAGLMLVMAGVVWRAVPDTGEPRAGQRYSALLRSMFALYATEPVLRRRGGFALLIFAAFSVLWTAMVLPLSAPPLSLSHAHIGLFGLAGITGALAAARAGRWADEGKGSRTTGSALGLLVVSWLPIALAHRSLLALALGVAMLDFAVQAVHVTNQSLILAARPDAQSRMVGAYMCCYSAGSGLGAVAATQAYAHGGWLAVCLLGAGISAVAWCVWWLDRATGTVAPSPSFKE